MQPDGVLFLDGRRPCYGLLEEKNKTKQKKAARVSFSTRLTRITKKELEQEIKTNKQRRQISLETKHKNFFAVVRKWEMLVASKLNMRGIEKESEMEPKQPIFLWEHTTFPS